MELKQPAKRGHRPKAPKPDRADLIRRLRKSARDTAKNGFEDIYTKLADRGSTIAIELQLVRSLCGRFQTDLEHLATPATPVNLLTTSERLPPAPMFSSAPTLPRIAILTGTADKLEFLARLPNAIEPSTGAVTAGIEPRPPSSYQLITYQWQPAPDLLDPGAIVVPVPINPSQDVGFQATSDPPDAMIMGDVDVASNGLVRYVRSWFQVVMEARHRALTAAPDQLDPAEVEQPSGLESTPFACQREHVPEVTKLQFRYFDGSRWRLNWNSGSDGILPLAIEVAFDVHPEAGLEPPPSKEEEQVSADDDLFDLEMDFQDGSVVGRAAHDPDAISTAYRFVIALDAAFREPPRIIHELSQ